MKILKGIIIFIYVNNYILRQGVAEPAFLKAVATQQARSFDATMRSQGSIIGSWDLLQKLQVLQIVLIINRHQGTLESKISTSRDQHSAKGTWSFKSHEKWITFLVSHHTRFFQWHQWYPQLWEKYHSCFSFGNQLSLYIVQTSLVPRSPHSPPHLHSKFAKNCLHFIESKF